MSEKHVIKLESGIPIPGYGKGVAGGCKYPLLLVMQVGDSFLIPTDGTCQNATGVRNYIYPWSKNHGQKHTVRIVDGGVRVWRVA